MVMCSSFVVHGKIKTHPTRMQPLTAVHGMRGCNEARSSFVHCRRSIARDDPRSFGGNGLWQRPAFKSRLD